MAYDAKRGNAPLTVCPLNPLTESSIPYKSDGTIFSLDLDTNTNLDKTLNLNCFQVGSVGNRLEALRAMLNELNEEHSTGDIKLTYSRLLQKYQYQVQKAPYSGILI